MGMFDWMRGPMEDFVQGIPGTIEHIGNSLTGKPNTAIPTGPTASAARSENLTGAGALNNVDAPPSRPEDLNNPTADAENAADQEAKDEDPECITGKCPIKCDYKKFFWEEILGHEGGYVDDPVDRGGKTKYGVTLGTWKQYSQSLFGIAPSAKTLKAMTPEQAFEIFRVGYWRPSGADRIRDCPLAFQISDISYNSGSGNSTKILQRAINDLGGAVTVDGAIGSQTIDTANSLPASNLYIKVRERRWKFYEAIMRNDPSQERYRNGWKNRTDSFNAY